MEPMLLGGRRAEPLHVGSMAFDGDDLGGFEAGGDVAVARAKIDDYVKGKQDKAGETGDAKKVAALAEKILALIQEKPLYYTDIAEQFSAYDFQLVARAMGHLHTTEKLWQDDKGRMCMRGSKFAAKLPTR